MSAYDDMLIRMGQPDEADESDEQIAEAVKAAGNLRWLLDNPEELLPFSEDDPEAAA